MCVNNLSKVALDSAAAGIEPAISSRKFNALTTTPPSQGAVHINVRQMSRLYGANVTLAYNIEVAFIL